jgi:hypothetical protein
MSQQNILFEDNLIIQHIDKDGKHFDKVSRIEGIAEDSQCEIQLDINCDIYPIKKQFLYGIMWVERYLCIKVNRKAKETELEKEK